MGLGIEDQALMGMGVSLHHPVAFAWSLVGIG
jgi:hypothetical protein